MRRRLILILALILSPILFLSGVQAYFDTRASLADRRNELLVITDQALDRMENSVAAAEQLLGVFAPEIASGGCERVYDRIGRVVFGLSNVAYFDRRGRALCSSLGEAGFMIADPAWLDQLEAGEDFVRTHPFYGPITDSEIFAVTRRVEDERGEFVGAAAFALRIDSYLDLLEGDEVPETVSILLSGPDGTLFGEDSKGQLNTDFIEQARGEHAGALFVERDSPQGATDVVVREVWPDGLYAIVLQPSPGLWSEASLRPVRLFGLPLLTIAVTLLVAWLAMDYLVIGWLNRLRALIRSYGHGLYGFRTSQAFDRAPEEVASLADTLERMAERIGERDATLKDAIAVRDQAVKEIHHRVKNNLQIVTSFLNLQSRQVDNRDARAALAVARHRIDALSIVHQTLYQHERLDTVALEPFLDGLLKHLTEALGMAEAGVTLTTDIADAELDSDAAIPLALLALEAITNSMKYAFEHGRDGEIAVTLTEEAGELELTIRDNGVGIDLDAANAPDQAGLGSKLMNAFARQLGGQLETDSRVGEGYTISLRFQPLPRGRQTRRDTLKSL